MRLLITVLITIVAWENRYTLINLIETLANSVSQWCKVVHCGREWLLGVLPVTVYLLDKCYLFFKAFSKYIKSAVRLNTIQLPHCQPHYINVLNVLRRCINVSRENDRCVGRVVCVRNVLCIVVDGGGGRPSCRGGCNVTFHLRYLMVTDTLLRKYVTNVTGFASCVQINVSLKERG